MKTYETVDGLDYTLPNIGRTVKGKIETDAVIENPNFVLIHDDEAKDQAPAATPEAPAKPTTGDNIE